MEAYSKNSLVKHFFLEDQTADVGSIVKVAVLEAADFVGAVMSHKYNMEEMEFYVSELHLALNQMDYEKIHDYCQFSYELATGKKELEGMYFALENKKVSQIYFHFFVSAVEMNVFTMKSLVAMKGEIKNVQTI